MGEYFLGAAFFVVAVGMLIIGYQIHIYGYEDDEDDKKAKEKAANSAV